MNSLTQYWQFGASLLAIGIAWGTSATTLAEQEEKIKKLEEDRTILIQIQIQQGIINERTKSINNDIQRILEKVDK